ncbi:hypothetical protein MMC31_006367 [Peltigera leucophlebia]|nr:hypothetical protein [Peltigera leucophlebia]
MDPSQQGNPGRITQAPPDAQLLVFADAETVFAGMKRAADSVSDLEVPGGSRPMRHSLNNPENGPQQQPSSDPVPSSSTADGSKSKSDENQLSVPQQQQLDSSQPSLQSSLPLVAPNLTGNAIDSTVPRPPSAAAPTPASSDTLRSSSGMISTEPINYLSSLDRRSPIVQSLIREAFNEGRLEERREGEVKLDEAESKVEELRRRLDPSKIKAAYDRGYREGGIAGYNKYSLYPEAKASDDRLAFEKICKEKDQAIYDQQMTIARYQKDLTASGHRIHELEQQASLPVPQYPPQQQGQIMSGQQITDAEARFNAQAQELAFEKSQSELMRADLSNWQVQWGFITADLETKTSQLDACQRQLDCSNCELKEGKEEASQLASAKSEEISSLKATIKELESKLSVLSSDFNSLEGLYSTLTKAADERSVEIQSVKALNEELKSNSKKVEDGKDEINALTSKNNELIKIRGDLEEAVARQDEELQHLSAENEELTKKLKKREEEDERAPLDQNNAPSQDEDQQAEGIDNLPADLAEETANVELVYIMLEKNRVKTEAETLERENKMTTTLERMEETERRKRQMVMDELEHKDAQLYDAQKQIRELTERLLAASPSQQSQSSPFAASSFSPPEASPSPTAHPPPPTAATPSPPPAGTTSLFHLPRLVSATDAETNFSPRRLLIMLFIFLFTFFFRYLHSPSSRPATENTNSGQVTNEVLTWPEEARSASEAYEDGRRRWEAWAMTNWDRNERIARGEELSMEEKECRPIPGFEY